MTVSESPLLRSTELKVFSAIRVPSPAPPGVPSWLASNRTGKRIPRALSVDADSVDCAINGTVVASYPKAEVVGDGKLKSTDGVYGIRFAHNTDAVVTGFTMTKQ